MSACTLWTHDRQQLALSSVEWLMARAGDGGPTLALCYSVMFAGHSLRRWHTIETALGGWPMLLVLAINEIKHFLLVGLPYVMANVRVTFYRSQVGESGECDVKKTRLLSASCVYKQNTL